ncbi:MAG: Asp23/Gls24 family envelope stress response protein [Eubacteriales bacterium]|nr:Asp23/Gls24 family envelope stress response protein [Eubacteriales bacterium]MDD4389456.1 Asp23/Gls24 family envelope stress response protein [Eubacteriales bacterium]
MSGDSGHRATNIRDSEDFIVACIAKATLKTPGVAVLGNTFAETISKNILGRTLMYNGIKLSHNDEGYVLDVFVVVEYGVNIPSVAWDLQENIKKEIENRSFQELKSINIYVQGVKFPD